MKFIEELKAAQAIIDADTKGGHFDLKGGDYIDVNDEEGSREVAAVLRRIPQLIEVVEWVETIKEKLNNNSKLSCCGKSNLGMLRELLSKLEGKKDGE